MTKKAFGVLLSAFCCSMLPAGTAGAGEVVLGQIASVTSVSAGGLATSSNLGYRVYFEKLNRAGGVNGNTVKLILKDDDVKLDRMLKALRELLDDKSVIGLVGILNTPGLTEISKQKLLEKEGIALVAPQQGDKNIVSAENFFPFRTGYLDETAALVREAKETQKQRVFIVYQTTTIGPINAGFAEQEAKRLGLNIVGKVSYETAPPEKYTATTRVVIEQVAKSRADAVLTFASGAPAFHLIAAMRDSGAEPHVVYGMSPLNVSDIPKTVPFSKVHGVVVAQSIPYPHSGVIPVVREYQKAMKEFAPDKRPDYLSLEGYIAAKICHEALKRAGKKPTRQSFLAALKSLGELDLGGVSVKYSDTVRQGWGGVDLTIIDRNGRLQR